MMSDSPVKRKSLSKPSLFETRDLIRLVRDRKCLWDRYTPEYRDRTAKEKCWLEIYKAVEPDYDLFTEDMKNLIGMQVTRKWYNVRDSYVKSRKSGARGKPYVYSKLLTFLEPIYFEDSKSDNETGDQWLNDVFVIDEQNESAKRQKLDLDKVETEENICSILANLVSNENDEDRAFFRSITPAVKKLSDDSKMEFRIQVMNILKDLKNKDKNDLRLKKETMDFGQSD